MPELKFETIHGSWKGNDYPSVAMTSVSVGAGRPVAFVFMTHMNIDFDGAPNAYGPPEKHPLDSLDNAGRHGGSGYYGLVAVDPNAVMPGDHQKRKFKDVLKLDSRFPDTKGRVPVVQKDGPYAGFYVSTTSKRSASGSRSPYEQSHYIDSGSIAFSALSYGLQHQGVGDADLGIAIRHDTGRQASFTFLGGEGHGKGSPNAGAVGECSYKVFLDIGGKPKTSAQKYVNNNFPTTFIVFPGSKVSQLSRISVADNAEDFAAFVAIQAHVDGRGRGQSGVPAFLKYVAGGRTPKPVNYDKVAASLRPWGYSPGLGAFVKAAAEVVSSVRSAVGKMVP